jgi:ABC-type nitrate/sulfonate/bicarbonate transport system substrate-binding protein
VAPAWPAGILAARTQFLETHPRTIRAWLRAYVRAVRLARADPEVAIRTLTAVFKFERAAAERVYREVMPDIDERGRLPVASMPAVWQVMVTAGEVDAPWPESRFLDTRLMDTFDGWAPPLP